MRCEGWPTTGGWVTTGGRGPGGNAGRNPRDLALPGCSNSHAGPVAVHGRNHHANIPVDDNPLTSASAQYQDGSVFSVSVRETTPRPRSSLGDSSPSLSGVGRALGWTFGYQGRRRLGPPCGIWFGSLRAE